MLKKKFYLSSKVFALVAFMVFFFVVSAVAQNAAAVLEISGKVTDTSGQAIENAIVRAVDSSVSAVLTDAKGEYKFYLVGQKKAFTLQVSMDRYRVKNSQPIRPNITKGQVKFDAVLEPAKKPKVEMEDFTSGVSISGRVVGIDDFGKHKILVYVLTNQWYIHPYAENKDSKGYASIKADGSWSIRTVNREHHPFMLAMLVVPKSYVPPSVIAAGEDAKQSLFARIGRNLSAFQIIPAPEGL